MPPSDRDAMPERYTPGSMPAITAAIGAGPIERALQIARWIKESPRAYEPMLCDAMPGHGFSEHVTGARELYGKHRAKVTWVEGQNASRLATIVRQLLALMENTTPNQELAVKRAAGIQWLGSFLVDRWSIGASELPVTSGDKYQPIDAWARKKTRLPQCLPDNEREREFASTESAVAKRRDFTGAPKYSGARP